MALVRAGKPTEGVTFELGIHPVTLSKWMRQDAIDSGARPGVPSQESVELRLARRRIREFEQELMIVRTAAKFLKGEEPLAPQGSTR